MSHITRKAFTFVEMIIVVGVLGLILPSLFAIIFSILSQQVKIISLSEVKRQSDYALYIMNNLIKNNAVAVYDATDTEICKEKTESPVAVISFKDKDNKYFGFYTDKVANSYFKLASRSSVLEIERDLFTSKVRIKTKPDDPTSAVFTITCSRSSSYAPPIISISFTSEYNTSSTSSDSETASMQYQTNIKMKSY